MITVIYSTHKDVEYNNKFKNHLKNTCGVEDIQILEYINHNKFSLSQVYNSGITESKYDIVVCCHNDIKLEKNWGKKLLDDFFKNPEFGIIGKAGSCYFPESGVYWEKLHQTMVGQVYHFPPGQKKFLSKYSPKLPQLIPVVTIDGLFISFDKNKIKHKFDESFGKFHFYDHGFSVPNYVDGVKIGVTSSFEITHESVGQPNQEFWESKEKFLNKWKKVLPLDIKPQNVFINELNFKKNKKLKKVAVIIPTKGKTELLFDCVKSLYEKCDNSVFDVFIADTGSSDNEKNFIKKNILSLGNVTLIEYDYYNFSKINNDVVKNHISEKYEFLLFCNNDIKLLNDAVSGMLEVFSKKNNAGTVGIRLHFRDNTIQHDGVAVVFRSNTQSIDVGHLNFRNYFNYKIGLNETFGNTGGFMMIRKSTFIKLGLFNENYISCLEDVELNIKCLLSGLKNYTDSSCVGYHYESQTRNDEKEKNEKYKYDYLQNLLPFIQTNISKLKNHIKVI
jgi:GT2 family glycosyltransferase